MFRVYHVKVSPESSLNGIFGASFAERMEAELHCRRIVFMSSKTLISTDVASKHSPP